MVTIQEPPEMGIDEVRVKVLHVREYISPHSGNKMLTVIFDSGDAMFCSERNPMTLIRLWTYAEARVLPPPIRGFDFDANSLIGKEYLFDRKMRSVRPIPEVEDLRDLYREIDFAFLNIQIEEDVFYEKGEWNED